MTPTQNAQSKTFEIAHQLAYEIDNMQDFFRMRINRKFRDKGTVEFRVMVANKFKNGNN